MGIGDYQTLPGQDQSMFLQPMSGYHSEQPVQSGYLPGQNNLVNGGNTVLDRGRRLTKGVNRALGLTTDRVPVEEVIGNMNTLAFMASQTSTGEGSFNPVLHNNGQQNTLMPHGPQTQTNPLNNTQPLKNAAQLQFGDSVEHLGPPTGTFIDLTDFWNLTESGKANYNHIW